jgi:hypothetical protein
MYKIIHSFRNFEWERVFYPNPLTIYTWYVRHAWHIMTLKIAHE